MSVARVTEITAGSKKSFNDAVEEGVRRFVDWYQAYYGAATD